MKEEGAEIVKSGKWLYGGTVEHEVWIVRQNFEYWHEEEYDASERLNDEGEVFAVLYARDGTVVGRGSEELNLEEAIKSAERAIAGGIQSTDHRMGLLFGGRAYRLSGENTTPAEDEE